ncbi:MAG: superoxide dismutase family protein [Symploca sp. SIO1A3]|nr:superoxide dismutase family protein [Symploca sp. SIO2C1]NER52625.1 superoxide dismutase family protein [Symploca sp. SIO1A3]
MKSIHQTIRVTAIAFLFSTLTLVYGCQPTPPPAAEQPVEDSTPQVAVALISTTSEPSKAMGKVSFTETDTGMVIEAQIKNTPPGDHGFHIHEKGSCEEGGKAAGGHYNPDGVKHGNLVKDGFANAHAGDLGNISVVEDGTATYNATIKGLTLQGEKYPIDGLAMIVHEKPDDFGQPTGNAGGRIGCGVIALSDS